MGFSSATLFVLLQLVLLQTERASGAGVGTVSCRVSLDLSREIASAQKSCHQKHIQQHRERNDRNPHKTLPNIKSLDDFDYDDHCQSLCVMQTAGIIGRNQTLPDKRQTCRLFEGVKISRKNFEKITSLWESCIDTAARISKNRGHDKCKTATLLEYCFYTKIQAAEKMLQVEC